MRRRNNYKLLTNYRIRRYYFLIPMNSMTCRRTVCLSWSCEDGEEKTHVQVYLALPMSYTYESEEWLLSATLYALLRFLSWAVHIQHFLLDLINLWIILANIYELFHQSSKFQPAMKEKLSFTIFYR